MMAQPDKQTVLIVDDAVIQLRALGDALKNDYIIKAVKDGYAALDIVFSDSPPDIVLLDIVMPGLDGYEVCRRLKRKERTRQIPVIFISAMDDHQDETKGFDIGAVDYIKKPFIEAVVRSRIKTHLDLKAHRDLLQQTNHRLNRAVDRVADLNRRIKDAYSELNQIFNTITDGVVVIDMDGVIIRMNQAYGRLTGIDTRTAVGRKCYTVINRKICHSPDCPLRRISAGKDLAGIEIEEIQFDGKSVPCLFTPAVFRVPGGDLSGIIECVKNVTDLKNAETERTNREKLQAALEMSGAVCHEMNQPLQAIFGYTELVLNKMPADDPLYEKIVSIESQVNRMKLLSQKLMQISRYETKSYIKGTKIIDIDKASSIKKWN
jgi:PAS domain S-box-containing protein